MTPQESPSAVEVLTEVERKALAAMMSNNAHDAGDIESEPSIADDEDEYWAFHAFHGIRKLIASYDRPSLTREAPKGVSELTVGATIHYGDDWFREYRAGGVTFLVSLDVPEAAVGGALFPRAALASPAPSEGRVLAAAREVADWPDADLREFSEPLANEVATLREALAATPTTTEAKPGFICIRGMGIAPCKCEKCIDATTPPEAARGEAVGERFYVTENDGGWVIYDNAKTNGWFFNFGRELNPVWVKSLARELNKLVATPAPADESRDAARLDFVLRKMAFTNEKQADSGAPTFQLWTQDMDENYIVLSGDDRWWPTERAAIDAAISPKSGEGE